MKREELNPLVYFEIPATDLKRASRFYDQVFGFQFASKIIDQKDTQRYPFEEKKLGISGALIQGAKIHPQKENILLYLKTFDIEEVQKLVLESGGKILISKNIEDQHRYIAAEIEDSEGNRIALHQVYPAK